MNPTRGKVWGVLGLLVLSAGLLSACGKRETDAQFELRVRKEITDGCNKGAEKQMGEADSRVRDAVLGACICVVDKTIKEVGIPEMRRMEKEKKLDEMHKAMEAQLPACLQAEMEKIKAQ